MKHEWVCGGKDGCCDWTVRIQLGMMGEDDGQTVKQINKCSKHTTISCLFMLVHGIQVPKMKHTMLNTHILHQAQSNIEGAMLTSRSSLVLVVFGVLGSCSFCCGLWWLFFSFVFFTLVPLLSVVFWNCKFLSREEWAASLC